MAAAAGDRRAPAENAIERAELACAREAPSLARRHLDTALLHLEALYGACHPELLPVFDALARTAREDDDPDGWRRHAAKAADCAERLRLPEAERRRTELP